MKRKSPVNHFGGRGAFDASLPKVATPGEQILVDLDVMNAAGVLTDGTMPLAVWLKNAITLSASRRESLTFEQALNLCEEVVGSDVPAPPTNAMVSMASSIVARFVRSSSERIPEPAGDLSTLLRGSPRVAAIEAFTLIERAVREASVRHGLDQQIYGGVRNALRELEQRGLFPSEVRSLFNELRARRNELSDMAEADISELDAWRYINAAKVLAGRISQL